MPKIDLGLVKGPQGDTGPQGAVGPTGAQGIEGPAGKDATVNGYNATTLEVSGNLKLQQQDGAITIQTTPELDSAVQWHSNPNLLDNWYFGNPVNQRGQTEYATLGYTIDRWKLERGSIAVENGYITLQNAILRILLEDELFTVDNQNATFSILTKDGILTSHTFSVPDGKYGNETISIGIDTANVQVGHALPKGSFFVINIPNASVDIVAIKVEYGTTQTLAHQENGVWVLNEVPDYTLELLKCQRYLRPVIISPAETGLLCQYYAYSQTLLYSTIFQQEMRAAPTLITVGTGTFRVADYASISSIDRYEMGSAYKTGAEIGFHVTDGSKMTDRQIYAIDALKGNIRLLLSAEL